jgi:hypothetical protein
MFFQDFPLQCIAEISEFLGAMRPLLKIFQSNRCQAIPCGEPRHLSHKS